MREDHRQPEREREKLQWGAEELETLAHLVKRITDENSDATVEESSPYWRECIVNSDGEPIVEDYSSDLFDGIMQLEEDFGKMLILEGVQIIAKLDSENEEYCSEFRGEEAWLAIELEQLLHGYRKRCLGNRKLMGVIEV